MKIARKFISYILSWFGYTVQFNKMDLSSFEKTKKTFLTFRQNANLSSYSRSLNNLSSRNIKRVRFVNKGSGAHTTLTHALVKDGKNMYFEKVYDKKAKMYVCLKTNYHYIYQQLKTLSIAIPQLIEVIETEHLAICHFEYLPKITSKKDGSLDLYFKTIDVLRQVPQSSSFLNRNYLELRRFREEFSRITLNVIGFTREFDQLQEIKRFVDQQEKVFAHGDFDPGNIFEDGIIDWDEAGFYPYGIDASKAIFHQQYHKDKQLTMQQLFQVLEGYPLKNAEKINVLYFYILLVQRYISPEQTKTWISDLYTHYQATEIKWHSVG